MIRVLSAAVLIAIVVGTVWFMPPWATLAVGALAAAVGATELAAMSKQLGARVSPMFLAAASATICVAFAWGKAIPSGVGADSVLISTLLALVIAAGAMTLAAGPPDAFTVQRAAVTFMAPLYVGLPFGALCAVRATHGPQGFSALFVLLIVSDSAQYYCGRAFGRRKLAPLVSPGKTTEGAIGGLLFATVTGALVAPWMGVPAIVGAAAGLVLSIVGMVGDLFESLLKRGAGMKDSSALIPGHGGVLDRVDSYLFAAPVYFIFLRYLA